MSADTKIEWTHMPGFLPKSWNPVRGCSRISKGCENCYAERIAVRFSAPGKPFDGFAESGWANRTAWTGKVSLIPEALDAPLRWRKPCCVFVNSMSDLFHESLSDEDIAAVFGVMAAAPQHRFLVLTKRAERMRRWFEWVAREREESQWAGGPVYAQCHPLSPFDSDYNDTEISWPLPNVWLGVSVENQATADERIPQLLATPAAVRFVSYEPALGPVSFFENGGDGRLVGPAVRHAGGKCGYIPGEPDDYWEEHEPGIDWLIVGGESGPGARPFNVAWARSAIEQCREAGVACFVKQLGARPILCSACRNSGLDSSGANWCQSCGGEGADEILAIRNRKGADPSEWPADLRVREWPEP